jgi:trimeric autotransporter adhesin
MSHISNTRRILTAVPLVGAAFLSNVASVSLSPGEVSSGSSSTGTVTLTTTAGAPTSLSLVSSNTAIARVPSEVNILPGLRSATFSVQTVSGAAGCPKISASAPKLGGQSVVLFVQPPAPTGSLRLSASSNSIVGGSSTQGQLSWSATMPAQGVTVQLTSSNPAATVPASVTILPGNVIEGGVYVIRFPITTTVVAPSTCSVITATSGTSRASMLLKIATISG